MAVPANYNILEKEYKKIIKDKYLEIEIKKKCITLKLPQCLY